MSTINDLSEQSVKDFEIIIIDQTTNPEFDFSNFDLNIRYFTCTQKSASAARNLGILKSASEIILFLDDDVAISNQYFVANHLRHYVDKATPGVAGCIMDPNGIKRTTRSRLSYKKYVGWLVFPRNYAFPEKVRTGGSGNLSVRKILAIDVGGMDERYEKGAHREESDFCLRLTNAHGLLVYDPEADLIHIGSPAGGIRSWNLDSAVVKNQQHFDGAFYFMIKNYKWSEFPYHLAMTLYYFLFDRRLVKRPYLFFLIFYRMLKGVFYGIRNYKNPKYINP